MALPDDIREHLKTKGGHVPFKEIRKAVDATKIEINRALSDLSKRNLVMRINPGEAPPIWKSLEVVKAAPEAPEVPYVETLVLLDTGGYPNLYLPLAKGVLNDEEMVILAPLDHQTNPKGISESSKSHERRAVQQAEETGRFQSPRSREMTPEYADVMLAALATTFLSKNKVKSCVVIGKDRHNYALIKVIEELFAVKCEQISKEEEALDLLLS